jgi:hypothetical protein
MERRHQWNALTDEGRNDSSISSASRNEAISSPPPIIQMCFPGVVRRRCANAFTGSDTNSTPGAARFGGFRENT